MLPKFRPATLGLTATARPSIRPVKASPPPPAPSPPRRRESGFGPRSGSDFAQESQAAIETERFDEEQDMPTAGGLHGDPSTLNRGPVTLPRVIVQASPRGGRGNVMQLSFDDETQARPVDDRLLDKLRRETAAAQNAKAELAVAYESLPSLEVRHPYDSVEAAFSERDPVTQAARESAHVRRADVRKEASYNGEPSYKEPSSYQEASYQDAPYQVSSYPPPNDSQQEEERWGRREDSGPRSRPLPPPSYAAPVPSYDDDSRPWGEPPPPVGLGYAATGFSSMPAPPAQAHQSYPAYEQSIPPAPRVPEEMRAAPGFVMGVQPIRTATPEAWVAQAPPQQMMGLPSPMQAIHAAMPAGYGVAANQQVHPYMVAASPRGMNVTPYPQQQQGYYPVQPQQGYPMPRHATPMPGSGPVMSASMAGRAQPVGAQLTTPPLSSAAKVGRFTWFVAGAAFGITFAFFATGFFNGGKVARDELPTAAPTQVAAPIAAPVAAPIAPAIMTSAPPAVPMAAAPQPTTPASLPNVTLSGQPKPETVSGSTAAAAPRFSAPRPRPAFRRPAAPASQAPKALPGSGETEAPAPSAPPRSAGGDLSDLLGAGLKP